MIQSISIDDENRLDYYNTPWDGRSFGLKTREICTLEFSHIELLDKLLKKLDAQNEIDHINFIYTRIPGHNNPLKITLQKNGYRFVETSLKLKSDHFEPSNSYRIFKTNMKMIKPDEADYNQIRNIARDDFMFGRFHEDPLIPDEHARDRYYQWIGDLRRQGKEFLMFKKDNLVISFLAYERKDLDIDLILGGSRISYGYMSYYFWGSFLKYFKESGIRIVRTTVSAANTGILNLYIKFGFIVDETLFGFHKRYTW